MEIHNHICTECKKKFTYSKECPALESMPPQFFDQQGLGKDGCECMSAPKDSKLDALAKEAHETAVEKGWWDDCRNEGMLDYSSAEPIEKRRAALILKKDAIDASIRELKKTIATAKTDAAKGRYMDRNQFRLLESTLLDAQGKSLGCQRALGELRKEEQAKQPEKERKFIELVRTYLDEDEWLELWAQVNESET
jgi:hypothetical protein